jgi:phospholipid/cholesterol/gamma-HCH transport system substrate-binding protein/paraquat-inducible protein B
MSKKANYFTVGLFVIVAFALLIAAVIFWGSQALTQKKYYIETYLDEAVKGLTIGSPVNYRGVKIGQVERIAFVPSEYDIEPGTDDFVKYGRYVFILMSLSHERVLVQDRPDLIIEKMVESGLRLRMISQPLTGVGTLELDYLDLDRDKQPKPLAIIWKPKHTYVPSAPSVFSELIQSFESVLGKLEALEIEKVIESANNLLVNLNKAVDEAQIGVISGEVSDLLAETKDGITQIKSFLRTSEGPRPQAALEDIMVSLDKTIQRINRLIKAQSPEIDRAVKNISQTSENLKDVTEDLKAQPSKIIFSEPPAKSETVK